MLETGEEGINVNPVDRCRGLMVGLGVGNVLGVPQEGWPRRAVEAAYPNGIREIELEPGEPDDDDLAQAIILAEAAIEAGTGTWGLPGGRRSCGDGAGGRA